MKSIDQSSGTHIDNLYSNIRELIESAKPAIVTHVNQVLVFTYWQIGKVINTDVLREGRAEYGNASISQLAAKLVLEYGSGFGQRNLFRMVRFYQEFSDINILTTLSAKLSWSHFVELIKLEDSIKREFYSNMCVEGRWSVRTLRERIDSMLFERTGISKQPDAIIQAELELLQKHQTFTPRLFLKDPYLLDFLDLKDNFSESDLENAILLELERFLLELGSDFAFMARQKRIQVGGSDYYIDLLFFHRKLKRLVLIELKLGDFKPEYKGQVEFYLKWLAKNEQQPGEQPPIAIILCSGKDMEIVELLDLEPENIHIAEYWLKLPPKEVLQAKLHKAMQEARSKLEFHEKGDGNE